MIQYGFLSFFNFRYILFTSSEINFNLYIISNIPIKYINLLYNYHYIPDQKLKKHLFFISLDLEFIFKKYIMYIIINK